MELPPYEIITATAMVKTIMAAPRRVAAMVCEMFTSVCLITVI